MLFKGTTLLARKAIITRDFGAQAWTSLVDDMAKRFPFFREQIVATSLVPMREFLAFHDEMLERFYRGDLDFYWKLGEDSGEWALTEGPYARFMKRKEIRSFVDSFPNLWTAYFHGTTSTCKTGIDGDAVWIKADNLPVWHPYFEYLVIGYLKRALQLLGVEEVVVRCVEGGPNAGRRFHYELRMKRMS